MKAFGHVKLLESKINAAKDQATLARLEVTTTRLYEAGLITAKQLVFLDAALCLHPNFLGDNQ